jgi:hypothetical protein
MKITYLYFILLLTTICFAQNNEVQVSLKDQILFEADSYVGNDGLGFNYFIKNSIFIKKSMTETFEYKNLALGAIQRADISNPLKIVLFYENFNTIVTVDNQLNETLRINLSMYEQPIVAAAAGIAAQNRFWIYNNLTQKIGLFDYLKNTYIDLTQSFDGNIKQYNSNFNEFTWIDENLNWYSCNLFGKIRNLGNAGDFEQIVILDDENLILSQNNKIFYKNLKNNVLKELKIEQKSFKSFFYKDQILTIFTPEGITNYKIKIP